MGACRGKYVRHRGLRVQRPGSTRAIVSLESEEFGAVCGAGGPWREGTGQAGSPKS